MANLKTIPKYGDRNADVGELQKALKAAGIDVGTIDEWFYKKTLAGLKKFQKSKGLKGTGVIPANGGKTFEYLGLKFTPPGEDELPKPSESDHAWNAPWVLANIDMLGRTETDPLLNARYVPEWAKEGLPGYKSLAGNTRAWCSVAHNADKRKVGVKGTDSAGAASWTKYGVACPFWFGASLPIRHKSGGRHIATFLYWIDEAKKIAAVYGGNQGNKLSIVSLDLSGRGDTLVPGPRWPANYPAGQLVSKAQVLAKYPFLKVGGSMGVTR